MTCHRIDLPDGFVIACSRERSKKCSSCGAHVKDGVLCDFVLKGWKTCDRHCCRSCATRAGPNLDYCPPHARYVALGEGGEDSPALVPAENRKKNKDNTMAIVAAQNIADMLNLKGAKVVQRSVKLKGGFEGRVRFLRTELGPTRNGPALFVKFAVVTTNDEDAAPVGSERTWRQSLMTSKGTEPAMNNILVWAACCAGMDPADAKGVEDNSEELDAIVKQACRDPENAAGQNPIVGVECGLVTEDTVTDGGKGRPFTIHMWSP